jgi:protein TonB
MNLDESGRRNGAFRSVDPSVLEEPGAWSSGELLRLLIAPAVVTLLLIGGVYWIRLQEPAGSAGQQQASIVQVHLLQRPDPASIPAATASQSVSASIASHADIPADEPSPTAFDDPVAIPSAQALSPVAAPASNIRPTPSPLNAPPSSATLKFQQALLRHVAQYQRYPNAARLRRLQGTVETLFSMRRDGTLLGVWVKTSSGQAVLDTEAVETIRRAQPLPSIPSELPDRLNVQVRLAFDPS